MNSLDSFFNRTDETTSTEKLQPRLKERNINYIWIDRDEHISKFLTMYNILGKGNYGVVYAAKENASTIERAVKVLPKKEGKVLKNNEHEMEILKFVDHPNIIHLHGIFESPENIYLVMDKCNGTLLDLFKLRKIFDERNTRRIINDLSSAVAYLHINGIVHRDIKMENILLVNICNPDDGIVLIKLTDFGLSIIKSGSTHHDMLHDRCGTLAYMRKKLEMKTPEIIQKKAYSQQCDIWAIGVLMYTLLSGRFPFARPNEKLMKRAILSETPNFDKLNVDAANKESTHHLMRRLLEKNPAHRSTVSEVLGHPWICGKPLQSLKCGNVLDMMARWRDELKVNETNSTEMDRRTSTSTSKSERITTKPSSQMTDQSKQSSAVQHAQLERNATSLNVNSKKLTREQDTYRNRSIADSTTPALSTYPTTATKPLPSSSNATRQ